MSKFTNSTNKFWSLVMTCLADVDGFKIIIQVCVAGLPTPDYDGRALVTLHHFLFIDVFAMLIVSFEHQNVITNKVYLL